jgi:hypothetical protein
MIQKSEEINGNVVHPFRDTGQLETKGPVRPKFSCIGHLFFQSGPYLMYVMTIWVRTENTVGLTGLFNV